MAQLTREYMSEAGVDPKTIELVLERQAAKAPPRTHFKHWVYLNPKQAVEIAERYADDPAFKMIKYAHVRKSRKNGKPLERIDI